jgi:hypothetical protein
MDGRGTSWLAAGALALAGAPLAGCGFTPLYATPGLSSGLSSIQVDAPNGRVAYLLRESLDDDLARDKNADPAWRLSFTIDQTRDPRGLTVNDYAQRYQVGLTIKGSVERAGNTAVQMLIFVALFGWIPACLILFMMLPARRAVVVGLIGAWILLPPASIPLSGIPDYDKSMATVLGVSLGTLIFQPNRFARSTPTTAPWRSATHAFICSGGKWISGYMPKYGSGSVAIVEKKFVGS